MDPKETRPQATESEPRARVTAIVVSFFTGDPLELCLRSLLAEPWVDQIVIVDNGNPKEVASSLRALQADRRDVRLIQGQGNVGFAKGCNLAASAASGRWLLFVDADVVLRRGAVEQMVKAGQRARSPWIVGGRLIDQKGREREASRREPLTPWTVFADAMGQGVFERAPVIRPRESGEAPAAKTQPISAVSGALMLMSKTDFDALGGFDEGYFLHIEDIDLCRRAGDAGGAVLLEPTAEALLCRAPHKIGRLTSERDKARGLARYLRKFARSPGERLLVGVLTPFLRLALVTRGLFGRRR